jgi:hypothetical protein
MTPLRHGRQLVAALAIGCAVWLHVAAAQPAPPLKVQNSFAQCVADAEPYLALDYRNFDQGVSADGKEWGWREISNKPGCETAAADLIALWMQRHGSELNDRTRLFMSFHEGQVRAMGGQFKRGAAMIEAGRGAWPSPEGAAYVDAILAFLRYDRPGLMAARERLMAVPEPKSWARMQEAFMKQVGRVPLWPQNIESVDKMLECFGKGYTGGSVGDCEWRAEQ